MKKISILVPAYNEEEVLHEFYKRTINALKDVPYEIEILFVNDGSKDNTQKIIEELSNKDPKVSYISLSRNFGKEIAMAAGFDYVRSDALVIIDADLQDPPELIPQMIELWEKGYDDIYAKRKSRKGETWLKKLTSSVFYRVLAKFSRVEIQRDTGDFRFLSKRSLDALKLYRENERYTKGLFSLIGFNKIELLYDRDPRFAGKTSWNYLKLTNLAIEGITSFTTAPLKFASVFGFFISIISFFYIVYIVSKTLIFGEPVAGYPSLVSIVMFLGGIQLLSLGIIGEYLGRTFNETKNRPLYFVDKHNFKA